MPEQSEVRQRYVCMDNCFLYISPGEHNQLAIPEAIPVGTILECKYVYNYFTYTNYKGVNGWVIDIAMMTGNGLSKLAYKSEKNIITTVDAKLYEQPTEYARTISTVPQNTELTVNYMYEYGNFGYEGYFLVSFNNQIGWLKVENCAIEESFGGPYQETVTFTEDILVDGKVIIEKGQTVELFSKYEDTSFWGQESLNYYFVHNGYGLWSKELGIYYPTDFYVVLLKNYEDLPTNQKLKVKYYTGFLGYENSWYASKYCVEYNGKMYDLEDFTGIAFDEKECNIYQAKQKIELMKSPYDRTVIGTIEEKDIFYNNAYNYREHNLSFSERLYYVTTEKGISGFVDLNNYENYSVVANSASIDEVQKYVDIFNSFSTEVINNENSGEYAEFLPYDLFGNYITNKDLVMFSDIFDEESEQEVILTNSEISLLGTAVLGRDIGEINRLYYHISHGDKKGYVMLESGDLIEKKNEIVEEQKTSGDETKNIYDIQISKKDKMQINIAVVCVVGAIILGLTAIVTIKLINKVSEEKNKKDNDLDNSDK